MSQTDYDAILRTFRDFQLILDPTSNRPPKCVSLVLVSSVAAVAIELRGNSHGNRELLEALNCELPREWILEDQQASLEAEGLVDLLVDEELEQIDEQRAISLAEELAEFEPYPEDEQDAITMASYALKPTRHLASELDTYAQHKTRVFAHNRQTTAVQGITADADKGGALRFLGWWSTAHQINVISLHDLRRLQPQHIEEYCNFLVDDREIKYGSVANYLNGIINLLSYLEANPQQGQGSSDEDGGDLDVVLDACINLRRQAEREAKTQRLYRRVHAAFVSWKGRQAACRPTSLTKLVIVRCEMHKAEQQRPHGPCAHTEAHRS